MGWASGLVLTDVGAVSQRVCLLNMRREVLRLYSWAQTHRLMFLFGKAPSTVSRYGHESWVVMSYIDMTPGPDNPSLNPRA